MTSQEPTPLGTAHPAHEEDPNGGLQLSTGARQQGVRGVARNAERGGDLGDVQPLRELHDDEVAVTVVEGRDTSSPVA